MMSRTTFRPQCLDLPVSIRRSASNGASGGEPPRLTWSVKVRATNGIIHTIDRVLIPLNI